MASVRRLIESTRPLTATAGAAVRGVILGIALIATVLSGAGVLTAIAFRAGLIGTRSIPDWGW